jgi:hypothetical protein
LYRLNPITGRITALARANERDGTGQRSMMIEGMAWDNTASEFIAFDDYSNNFVAVPLEGGRSRLVGKLSGLTDVESLAWFAPAQQTAA